MSDSFRNSGLCSVFLDHLREINTVHISWIKLGGTPCSQGINIDHDAPEYGHLESGKPDTGGCSHKEQVWIY